MTASVMLDTASQSLLRFEKEDEWTIRDGVPVFAEHEETGPDGNVVRRFSRQDLQEIADNCNRRELETGDACPIILGHIPDAATEMQIGDTVGYARSFRVGRFGPKGKWGILSKFYFLKAKYDQAMQYPRRSVELWKRERFFDPICLLKRTPKLDLGLLTYQRHSTHSKTLYAMDEPGSNEVDPQVLQLLQAISDKLDKLGGGASDFAAQGLSATSAMPAAYQKAPLAGTMPAAAVALAPAVGVLGSALVSDDRERMAREQGAITLARYQKQAEEQGEQLKAMQKRLDDESKKYQKAQRERDLVQLEAEGFLFDRAEELDDADSLDEAGWQKRQARIRSRYQKAPVGDPIRIHDGTPVEGGGKEKFGKAEMDRALQYMRASGCDWNEAMQAVTDGKA